MSDRMIHLVMKDGLIQSASVENVIEYESVNLSCCDKCIATGPMKLTIEWPIDLNALGVTKLVK